MATEKEEVIITFTIDQGEAEKNLLAVNKAILSNKEAISELTKAYKAGNITQDEYVKESLRIQQNLKQEKQLSQDLTKAITAQAGSIEALKQKNSELIKERNKLDVTSASNRQKIEELNKAIDKNSALIEKNSSKFEKQKFNIGNYASALDNFVPGVAKVSSTVTGLTGSLGGTIDAISKTGLSLQTLNTVPVVALVSSFIAVFDLLKTSAEAAGKEFLKNYTYIQDQQKALEGLTKATNNYVESIKQENELLAEIGGKEQQIIGNDQKANVLQINAQEKKIDLLKQEIVLLTNRNKFLDDAKNGTITEEQFNAQLSKQLSIQKAIDESGKTEKQYIDDKKKELEEEQKILTTLQNKDTVLGVRISNQRDKEKKDLDEIINKEKEREAIFKAQAEDFVNLKDQEALDKYQNNVTPETFAETSKSQETPTELDTSTGKRRTFLESLPGSEEYLKDQKEFVKVLADVIGPEKAKIYAEDAKLFIDFEKKKTDAQAEEQRKRNQLQQLSLQAAGSVFKGLSTLAEKHSDEQKELALIGIAFDTASAIVGGIAASQDVGYPANLVATATTIATILGDVAQAKAIIDGSGYSEGGYTGAGGKYEPAGIVHKGEVVWSQRDVALAGGANYVNAMRPTFKGYADGGIVTSNLTKEVNASVIQANAIKDLPPPEVSVYEITKHQNRVKVKQQIATL